MACDAYHLQHHIWVDVNQLKGDVDLDPAEFVAEEDINQLVYKSNVSEGVSCNNKTVKTSNLSNTRQSRYGWSDKQQVDQIGPLNFSPTPSLHFR